MLRIGALLALVVGCFGPQLPAEVSCSEGLCPDGLVCDRGICRDSLADIDAAVIPDAASPTDAAPCVSLTFEDGVDGYDSTEDTEIRELQPDEDQSAELEFGWDSGGLDGFTVGLVRFNNIFGNSAGQIPLGSQIESASLRVSVVNDGAEPKGRLREVLVDWNDSTTWNSFGDAPGFQGDLGEDISELPTELGSKEIELKDSLQSVSGGAPNRGWAFFPDNEDGVDVRSSEAAAERPRLEVVACP